MPAEEAKVPRRSTRPPVRRATARSPSTRRDDRAEARSAPTTTPPIVAGEPYTGPRLDAFAGARAARAWADHLVRDIADYKAGRIRWEDVDRGAVLHGPPGTGKTTFVRALAAATGLPLIITSYRDWMTAKDGHQGSMMQAMQKVFEQALAQRPCFVLIDELDSLPSRSSTHEHKDWWISLVNALLELVDGGQRREGVIVLGACNDPTRLDPALVRPGRLDRMIAMELPSIGDILDILHHHIDGAVPRSALAPVAVLATGQTGAQVEAIAREARRMARHAGRALAADDLLAAAIGPADAIPPDLLHRTAVHEAGHAFAALRLGIASEVSVSIVRRGASLGATRIERIVQGHTREVLEREIAVNLAGRAAEDVVLGSVSAGAGGGEDSDLARATDIAIRLVAAYGLSEKGGLVWLPEAAREHLLLSHPQLAAEVHAILDRCYVAVTGVLRREPTVFAELVAALAERRALDDAAVRTIVGEAGVPMPAGG